MISTVTLVVTGISVGINYKHPYPGGDFDFCGRNDKHCYRGGDWDFFGRSDKHCNITLVLMGTPAGTNLKHCQRDRASVVKSFACQRGVMTQRKNVPWMNYTSNGYCVRLQFKFKEEDNIHGYRNWMKECGTILANKLLDIC